MNQFGDLLVNFGALKIFFCKTISLLETQYFWCVRTQTTFLLKFGAVTALF
jgi:hypothetical protein